MKIISLGIISLFFAFQIAAQSTSNLYGIVRKNYFSTITSPFDSTITYQQFDSATVRLGYMDPVLGFVNNSGSATYNDAVNLTGAALNPYTNSFIFLGASKLNTFDLSSGALTNQVNLYNPIAASYFDNFRFNNSDSCMYGLARRNYYDSTLMTTVGQVYLAKANTQTGLIQQISTTSVAQGFALAGSAIDPYQMVYYFSIGSHLIGLDIYTGAIYSYAPITLTNGIAFDNFTYSCADTALYGLVRQNYYSYSPDPFFPGDSIQNFDSATVKLGRIDPFSGIVTEISPSSIAQGSFGGYSLNAGSAIDPSSMTYYYSNGASIVGVSMISGLVTSSPAFSFADGMYFDLMRNFDNCLTAVATRQNPLSLGMGSTNQNPTAVVYPNPCKDVLFVQTNENNQVEIIVTDILGQKLLQQSFVNSTSLSALQLPKGFYLYEIRNQNGWLKTGKFQKD